MYLNNDRHQELHEVLSPEYLKDLVTRGEAERKRLNNALELLYSGDMAFSSLTLLSEHLDRLLQGWRSELIKAKERVAVAKD